MRVNLQEQVIYIDPGFRRPANDRDFARQGMTTANAVHLQDIRPPHDPDEQRVTRNLIRGKMFLVEVGTAGCATP